MDLFVLGLVALTSTGMASDAGAAAAGPGTPAVEAARPPTPAARPEAFATAADVGDFVTGYYRAPRPERLLDALRAADRLGVVEEGTIGAFSSFAGEVLRARPDLVPAGTRAMAGASPAAQILWWRAVWTSGTSASLAALATAVGEAAPVRDALVTMRTAAPPDPLLAAITSPGELDVLWGAFFATGDGRIVVRVAALLDWASDADPERQAVAEAARWSLRTAVAGHPRVREVLETAVAAGGQGADPARVRALLDEPAPPPAAGAPATTP